MIAQASVSGQAQFVWKRFAPRYGGTGYDTRPGLREAMSR
jgi:hypothetical protein